ncbi:MAG TPA: hypothetical protein VK983_01280 [Candidatus Limnocylindrales bacterium]|nr:hypothetical protein [Candidatus Limnocylindrales bacterium]
MARIEEFNVIDPPTSLEVQDRAFEALRNNGVMPMILMPTREVPPPVSQNVSMRIHQTIHPVEGGMTISGRDELSRYSLTVRMTDDYENQATASLVIP